MLGEAILARADLWRHILALAPHPQGECRERPQAIVPSSTSDDWVPGLLQELASPAWLPHGLTAEDCPFALQPISRRRGAQPPGAQVPARLVRFAAADVSRPMAVGLPGCRSAP